MNNVFYTPSHEWLSIEDSKVTIGITEHAQDQLGEVVFVQLPDVDSKYNKGDEICVIESVKTAGEIMSPIAGTITEVNDALFDNPELVNQSPESEGWLCIIQTTDSINYTDLLTKEDYDKLVE